MILEMANGKVSQIGLFTISRLPFQCVYCSIGRPSYIWSTRRICASRV